MMLFGLAETMPWKQPARTVTVAAAKNAKALRKSLTKPEKKLWRALRFRLPLQGTHFRRQVALGAYVADFCCLKARLIVEVDGDQHGTDEAMAYDARRSDWLATAGYSVLRFTNRQVMMELEIVIDTIFASVSTLVPAVTTPTPDPSPQGGGDSPGSAACGAHVSKHRTP